MQLGPRLRWWLRPTNLQRRFGAAEGGAADQVTLVVVGVVDGVSGEKALGGTRRLEALHHPLATAQRQVSAFDAVVLPKPSGSVSVGQAQLP